MRVPKLASTLREGYGEVTDIAAITSEFIEGGEDALRATGDVPRGVQIYEINGPFFFGAAEKFRNRVGLAAARPPVLILRMRSVSASDSTALHALREVVRAARRDNQLVVLSGVRPDVRAALERSRLLDELGTDNLCPDIAEALTRARGHLSRNR